jgi:hypothetical protein
MTINGLHLLATIIAITIVIVTIDLIAWCRYDQERRSNRLIHRNLGRMSGR